MLTVCVCGEISTFTKPPLHQTGGSGQPKSFFFLFSNRQLLPLTKGARETRRKIHPDKRPTNDRHNTPPPFDYRHISTRGGGEEKARSCSPAKRGHWQQQPDEWLTIASLSSLPASAGCWQVNRLSSRFESRLWGADWPPAAPLLAFFPPLPSHREKCVFSVHN